MTSESQSFSVLVADDELLVRSRLVHILEELRTSLNIEQIFQAADGCEAFDILAKQQDRSNPIIAFLDIRMPKMNGLELALHISKMRKPPLVVFVTAHEEHAVEAFDKQAFDYIVKPARKERIMEVFQKLIHIRELTNKPMIPTDTIKRRSHISVAERGRICLIPLEDILYLKSEQKYTTIQTKTKEYLTEEPLISLEEEFVDYFVRIHRNCLVPKERIEGFEKNKSEESGWSAIVKDVEKKLPISRRQWAVIKDLYKEKS